MFEKMKIRYYVLLFILVAIGLELVLSQFDIPYELRSIIAEFGEIEMVAVLFFGYYFYKQKTSIHQVVHDQDIMRWFPSLILLAFVINTYTLTMFWYQLYLVDSIYQIEFPSQPLAVGTLYLIINMILSTVTGPIAEEFIFRGLLLNRLITKTNMWGGILISSFIFSAYHMNLNILIGTFLFGIIASLLYLKTKNLLVPIILHMGHNSIVFIETTVFPSWQEFLSVLTYSDLHTNVVFKSTIFGFSTGLMVVIIVYLSKEINTRVSPQEMKV
jgi:membrane protease YdiL (CAAX protease family)